MSANDERMRFLTARMRAQREGRFPRCWGRSSDALALFGLGEGPRPMVPGRQDSSAPSAGQSASCTITKTGVTSWRGDECGKNYPSDPSDLLACEETYRMAPADVQEIMLPVLVEFRAWVLDGINRHGERIDRMGWRGRVVGGQRVSIPEAWGECLAPTP